MRRAGVFARLRLPLVLAAVAVAYGTLGYRFVEGWGVLDAFYMTVITLTTVGYSEVHPLDAAGKLFTISLLALGVVALAAAIGAVTQLVAGGELGSWLRRRRMDTSLDRMSGHFIVCAYGRVGRAAVAQLRADRVPCLVIEPMPELAALLGEHGVPHLAADPAEEAVLRRAGVERAAGLLCAVDSDAVNVYITLTARPMNPKLTIVARASNPESVDKLHRAGADQVVSPYDLSGSRMAVLARHPAIVSFLDMVRVAPEWRLEETEVRQGARLDGKTIGQIRAAHPDVRILAVTQPGAGYSAFPPSDMTLGPRRSRPASRPGRRRPGRGRLSPPETTGDGGWQPAVCYPPCCHRYARQAVAVARFVNCRNNSSIRPWVRGERKGAMASLADELQAGIDEAARKMAEARLAGDDYGAGAWRERLSYLRRAARRHGVDLPPGPGPADHEAAEEPR